MEPVKFLPQRAPIEQFGAGGFRFAGMSHQGGLLVLPSGMRAWPVRSLAEITADHFAPMIAEKDAIDFVLQGIRFGRAKRLQALGRAPRPHKR